MQRHVTQAPQDNGTDAKPGDPARRRFVNFVAALAGLALFSGAAALLLAADKQPGCGNWNQPTDADFTAIVGKDKAEFLDRVLGVLENEVVPKTMEGVRAGNKVFGAAILKTSDLSAVIAATNTETDNPLMHGEVTAIFAFYDLPRDQRPAPRDTIFVATHEPCPLRLSSIPWGGWDNFFYLFSYEDSRDAHGIPHDIVMLDEIFRRSEGLTLRRTRSGAPGV
jgi:tRNA(Arg) A34 adenosine deaminase TadA